jgi:two-component system response regulator NreC
MQPRVLVVDDHALIRAGVRALLDRQSNYEIVEEVATSDEAIRAALEHNPEIVLLDVSIPGVGGIEVARRIRERLPETRVLILTVHEDVALLREALKAGATGYIVKRALDLELLTALEAVRRGEIYVHPSMTRALLEEERANQPRRQIHDPEALTNREMDVLKLIVRGYTNRQVADELDLSVRTVESHRAHILGKLGLSSRAELVHWAAERKLTT